jgi:choline kinase
MKIVIPMSGMSSRFVAAGYDIPKYLIEVDGRKVIEHIINLYPEDSDFVFIINDKHETETNIVDILDKLVEQKEIVTIPRHKKGPVFSVSEFEHLIDDYLGDIRDTRPPSYKLNSIYKKKFLENFSYICKL